MADINNQEINIGDEVQITGVVTRMSSGHVLVEVGNGGGSAIVLENKCRKTGWTRLAEGVMIAPVGTQTDG